MSEPKSVAYCMDCMEAMKKMPDKCFDLAVVDPPYGVNYKNGGANQRGHALAARKAYKDFGGNDMKPPPPEYFSELVRVSENQIIWGANHFSDLLPQVSHHWIVWDKVQMLHTYGDCELAWTSFPGQVRLFRYQWVGFLQGDMKNKEFRIHPTQKPVRLYEWIFGKYATEGDKILDTHLGSGSSRIAAWNAGLDFVGFEIDPDYFEKQEQRFREHSAQINLFHGIE